MICSQRALRTQSHTYTRPPYPPSFISRNTHIDHRKTETRRRGPGTGHADIQQKSLFLNTNTEGINECSITITQSEYGGPSTTQTGKTKTKDQHLSLTSSSEQNPLKKPPKDTKPLKPKKKKKQELTLPKSPQRSLHNKQQHAPTRRQPQHLGHEPLVQRAHAFFARDERERGVGPFVLWGDAGDLLGALDAGFHDVEGGVEGCACGWVK